MPQGMHRYGKSMTRKIRHRPMTFLSSPLQRDGKPKHTHFPRRKITLAKNLT